MKHINLEQRKIISSEIAHNNKLIEIAKRLKFNPRNILKEVRRKKHQVIILQISSPNDLLLYVQKYSNNCIYAKFKYDA